MSGDTALSPALANLLHEHSVAARRSIHSASAFCCPQNNWWCCILVPMDSGSIVIAPTNADMQKRIADVQQGMDVGYRLLRLSHANVERSRHDLAVLCTLWARRDEWASPPMTRYYPTTIPDTTES